MKDALGHGSDSNGLHSAPINNLPAKGTDWKDTVSDATWRATMPIANYTSQVADMLGLWSGGGLTASKLSADETKQINDAYEKRTDWRQLARGMQASRQSDEQQVLSKYVKGQ